jgi:penicillin-binding protein 2
MPPDQYFDWRRFHRDEHAPPAVVDSRRRLRWCMAGFVLLLAVVFSRMVELAVTDGPEYRELAARPLERQVSVPGVRGRILAANGVVLAYDKNVPALAVHYRYLEEPTDARWLRWTARSRLTRAERKEPGRVAAEEARVLADRSELARRLAELCGVSPQVWEARASRIQARVERISETVNRRRQAEFQRRLADADRHAGDDGEQSLGGRIRSALEDALTSSIDDAAPEPITVAEELDYHVVVEDVPLGVVAEIEAHADRYPGVKIVECRRRMYPCGSLAAHVLGHLGAVDAATLRDGGPGEYHPDDLVGKTGLERQYEQLLYGRRGTAVELTDRSGRVISSHREREPGVGRDLVLTLDPQLQRTAEELLAAALRRRAIQQPDAEPAGGACVVMDVRSGAILAAASAPTFDPNLFAAPAGDAVEQVLGDPAHPLFDRASQMAIPPGSTFKIVSAAALLSDGSVRPDRPLFCQGFLKTPDSWRCAIFLQHGSGHGDVTLADALAQSCNVYFFHYAERLGPQPLVDWGRRFGFGRPTGVDLPGESAGNLPSEPTDRDWRPSDALSLAIGQGSLQATPLQIARMMAAVAGGGRLVTPHAASHLGMRPSSDGSAAAEEDLSGDSIEIPPPTTIDRLDGPTLAAIREGLRRVVADPLGTAHGTFSIDSISVAGKTGTAQTGAEQADHAWFAGYAPADDPKLAFVVVLEHGGDAADAACPVAKRLVLAMADLGYFRRPGDVAKR